MLKAGTLHALRRKNLSGKDPTDGGDPVMEISTKARPKLIAENPFAARFDQSISTRGKTAPTKLSGKR